jgi:hypothetical protein
MKKLLLVLIITSAVLSVGALSSVQADDNIIKRNIINTVSTTPGQFRKQIKEIRISEKPDETGVVNRIKNFIKKNLKFNARITGTIASVGTNSITVTGDDSKTYTVNITTATRLVRRFGGKSQLSEFSAGNKINVFGKFTDDSKSIIDASLIRNLSVQKRWGVFFGEVTSKNSDNFVMKTVERGNQTVYFGSTKFVNRKEEPISYNDIQVGHRVRVKGIWDSSTNKITEVDQIKDFSIPVISPTQTGQD